MKRYLYWIYDDTCVDMWKDGYIGVTKRPMRRLTEHFYKERVPSNSKMKILMIGVEEYCRSVENKMRPHAYIGWNIAPGGGSGLRKEFTPTTATREKISRTLKEKNQTIEWEQRTCEHCSVACNAGTYARWHGDNCKLITGRTRPNYNSKEYKEARKSITGDE